MADEKNHIFECSAVPKRSFEYFESLRARKELCDITIHIGSELISVHRVILTAVIPYFRGVFTSEKDQEHASIPDVDPDALKSLIEFAYTCKVKIDEENVKDLLVAACHLGVDVVRDACCDFLVDILEYDNVMDIRQLADSLECVELLKCVECYIKRNFEQVSQTKGFLKCPSTYIKELISKDDVNVDNETKILEAVVNWAKSSPEERCNELPELMRKIRMPLMEPVYLTKMMKQEEIIRTSLLCRDLIEEARNYVLFSELRTGTCSFVTEPRNSMKTNETNDISSQYICALKGTMLFTAQHFDLENKEWQTKESHSLFLNCGSSAEMNKKMYFFYSDNLTKEYNPVSRDCKTLNPMPTARFFAAATTLEDRIYVCGGQTGLSPSNAVECFDPEKNEWTSRCFMKISCWGGSGVAFGAYIFILGGRDPTCAYNTVQRYDPAMDKWKIMPPLLTRRYRAAATTLNGKIYICGGLISLYETTMIVSSTGEVYDPIQKTSSFISSMIFARRDFALLSYRGKLYALGGADDDGKSVTRMAAYEPENNTWTYEEEYDEIRVSGAVVM